MAQGQLEKLKIQLGIQGNDQDESLKLLLDDVRDDLIVWTNRDALPSSLESTQRHIAVLRYNKQGIEGQTSHSEGGISRSFEDLPKSLQNAINQKRLAKVVRFSAT